MGAYNQGVLTNTYNILVVHSCNRLAVIYSNSHLLVRQWLFFHVGPYFCMGAYKHDVVVVIEIGAYIHGCLYPDFTV